MLFALQFVAVAEAPLNVTVLVPWLDPKLLPVIVTAVPIGPEIGDRFVTEGVGKTVKKTPLLATPPTVATTLPVVAPFGTVTPILFTLQFVTFAGLPLKVTVLVHWLAPKLFPVIVTAVPAGPDVGEMLAIAGGGPSTFRVPTVKYNSSVSG
jgi:hypothetical protein